MGSSCLGVILIMIILSGAGVELAHLTPDTTPGWVKAFGFVSGLGSEVLAGYVTARCARQAKKLHALIQGIVGMVVGVLVFVLPTHNPSGLSYVIAWLLSIPLTLWGGSLAVAQEEKRP